jgi:thiol-disulfide isomerase/thioredoxin
VKRVIILILVVVIAAYGYYRWHKPTLVNGDIAKDISGINGTGGSLKLSDWKGHYILLEFWGSWCGPCRKKHPEITKLYAEYKEKSFKEGKGFTIVSYALEDKLEDWKRAVDKDGLIWPGHIVDLNRMQAEGAQIYGVRSIPSSFLIDPEFRIIGVNLEAQAIRDILDRRIQ